jgi:tetratricopeptide (TPR) repeat protein
MLIPLFLFLSQLQGPTPTRDEHRAIIQKGIKAHDAGDFKGAVAFYRSILAENPADVAARYELTFSLFAMKDFDGCAAEASRGVQYDSGLRSRLYSVWASCLDDAAKPEEALKVFDEAIAKTEPNFLLHFNRAVTLSRGGRLPEARKGFQAALGLNPKHPSSHAFLSHAYDQEKYAIPALLATCRFLILEPNTPRSPDFAQKVVAYLDSRVQKKDAKSNDMTILVASDAKKDEGDFGAVEMSLGLAMAASTVKDRKKEAEIARIAGALQLAFSTLARVKPEGFAAEHYASYFAALHKSGHSEAFTYYALASAELPGTKEWLSGHQEEVNSFLEWTAKN